MSYVQADHTFHDRVSARGDDRVIETGPSPVLSYRQAALTSPLRWFGDINDGEELADD